MKKLINLLVLSVALASVPMLSSCATKPADPSTQVATYKTLASIGAAVDSAMKQAATARHLNQITEQQWQEIAKVHAQYLVAYNIAVDAAINSNAPAPANVIDLSARIAALVAGFIPTH